MTVTDPALPAAPEMRAIRVAPELFAGTFARSWDGSRKLTLEWGEPDAAGFYVPTVTETVDGKVLVGAIDLRQLREALETVAQGYHDDGDHGADGGPEAFRDCSDTYCRKAAAALAAGA